jgi:hypothetical protein
MSTHDTVQNTQERSSLTPSIDLVDPVTAPDLVDKNLTSAWVPEFRGDYLKVMAHSAPHLVLWEAPLCFADLLSPIGPVALLSEVLRRCAKSEVSAIDNPTKPSVNVQESIENAKFYCKRYPESFVSLRDYSGDVYNQTCAAFAAEQHATDSSYKIGSD